MIMYTKHKKYSVIHEGDHLISWQLTSKDTCHEIIFQPMHWAFGDITQILAFMPQISSDNVIICNGINFSNSLLSFILVLESLLSIFYPTKQAFFTLLKEEPSPK